MASKNILLIGAGAVGLVYGKQLAAGGHRITFLVRPKYVEDHADGTILYNLNKDRKLNKPIAFKDYQVISSMEEVAEQAWDQIYLCFSSKALQAYDFDQLKANLQGQPIIVMLQPGTADYNKLSRTFSRTEIVEGMITLISYWAPMSTESAEHPGVAYYFPPFMPTPFSGETGPRNEIIQTFKSGGIRASSTKSVPMDALFPSSFLGVFLTALEASNWKFRQLASDRPMLKDLEQALNEVFRGLEQKYKTKRPLPFYVAGKPTIIRMLLFLAPKVMPMDIETYFELHFTKVKSQTKMFIQEYIAIARSSGIEPEALLQLDSKT